MTRKDFKLIASVVANTLATIKPEARQCLALDFAHALKETNPRLDVNVFVKACLERELQMIPSQCK